MGNWRTGRNVLVTDADNVIAVAAIRDLGAAGYTVWSTSIFPDALGARSSYSAGHAQSPPYDSVADLVDWLDAFVRQHDITLIVPCSDNFLIAIHRHYERFSHLLPYPQADTVYNVVNKHRLFRQFDASRTPSDLTAHLPPYALIDGTSTDLDMEHLFRTLGGPLYVKVNALSSTTGAPDRVYRCDHAREAQKLLPALWENYSAALVQGSVEGVGIGAFLLIWDGDVKARFMHERIHEVPHTGGVSAYRRSTWNEDIYEDAAKRLRYLKWQGVAMLEYKWDPGSNRFWLLEINGRLWGSLHLALRSGVNFPRLLADAHYGRLDGTQLEYRLDVRCRHTFPLEAEYVRSCVRDGRIPGWHRWWCVIEFALLTANPAVKSDLFYPGDRRLYWIQLGRSMVEYAKLLWGRLAGSATPAARGPG